MSNVAITTVAMGNCLPELRLLLKSIRLFIGLVPVVVLCDEAVRTAMQEEPQVYCFLKPARFDLKKVGFDKTAVLRQAITQFQSALYCDADIFFLSNFDLPEMRGVVLSNHHIREAVARTYGFYNSGYVGCSDLTFLDWWDAQPKEVAGFYGDQQCLDKADKTGMFVEQHNVGWWRWESRPSPTAFNLSVMGGTILYNGAPLISVHTHLSKLPNYVPQNVGNGIPFNRFLWPCLKKSTDPRHKKLVGMMGEVYV